MLKPGMELLLFRLGDRGYASPRERVREVVDVGAGQPAVPGLSATRLSGYVTAAFQALGASWPLIDWDAIRLPTGITAPR